MLGLVDDGWESIWSIGKSMWCRLNGTLGWCGVACSCGWGCDAVRRGSGGELLSGWEFWWRSWAPRWRDGWWCDGCWVLCGNESDCGAWSVRWGVCTWFGSWCVGVRWCVGGLGVVNVDDDGDLWKPDVPLSGVAICGVESEILCGCVDVLMVVWDCAM